MGWGTDVPSENRTERKGAFGSNLRSILISEVWLFSSSSVLGAILRTIEFLIDNSHIHTDTQIENLCLQQTWGQCWAKCWEREKAGKGAAESLTSPLTPHKDPRV